MLGSTFIGVWYLGSCEYGWRSFNPDASGECKAIEAMRILSVIESLGRGGAEQLLVNLLPILHSRGYACEVAALFPPYDLEPELEKPGITVHRLDLSHRLDLARGVSKIALLCRRGDFDIVHAHLFWAAVYTAMSRPFAPLPRRAVTFHMAEYDFYPARNSGKRIRKACYKWLMRNWIDGCVAVSYDVARHFERHFRLRGITVIYNSFAPDALRPIEPFDARAVRARYGLPLEEFLLITPGRFSSEKGHRFLLTALCILREKRLHPRALLVGQGPSMKEIADQATEMGVQEQVIIRPPVPHDELMYLVQAADALVLPSLCEGFGLAAGEGMALERPVIATCVGGLSELVEDGVSGLHVPPGDPAQLAEAIARLMNEPQLRIRLGRAGRERILTKFNIDVVAGQWENFYQGLLKGEVAGRHERGRKGSLHLL